MRTVSISSAKNRLSTLVKGVQEGEPVVITNRGVPVAKLVRIRPGRGVPRRILGLSMQGLARLPERAPSAKWLELPWPKLKAGASPVDALLAERRKGW
jgi:prevent-host-death family protein